MNTYWRLLGFAKPIEKYAIPYFFYTLFYAAFNTFNFVLVMPILDTLFQQDTVEAVRQMPAFALNMDYFRGVINFLLYKTFGADYSKMDVLVFLGLFIITSSMLSNFFRYMGQRTIETMRIRTLEKLRNSVYDNVMGMHAGYFSNERKGDIISKISSDVQVVQFCITNTLQVAFRDPFLIIGYMVALVMISWKLTIFSALFLPLTALVIGSIVKRLRRSATEAQERFADMVSLMDESLSGIKILKSYNATGYTTDKFHRLNGLFSRISLGMARRQQLASPASEFLGISAAAVLLVYGGSLVLSGQLDASGFIAYLAMFTQITRPLRSFTDAFANINQGIAAGERVLALLDERSEIADAPGAVEMTGLRDRIEFRDVRFSYENKEVIRGVSFTIRKGETVALVGPSGGGKSTLSDLIPRFYDVTEGAVTIDGVDVRKLSQHQLREIIGYVPQKGMLFSGTVASNLRYGKEDATGQELQEALATAQAADFVNAMDEGVDSPISQGGTNVSGGQRQRLSIARALARKAPIYIFDDSFSALDFKTDAALRKALAAETRDAAVLIIAQRVSSIRHADQIVVLHEGQMAGIGTHEELMETCRVYQEIYESQTKEAEA